MVVIDDITHKELIALAKSLSKKNEGAGIEIIINAICNNKKDCCDIDYKIRKRD